MESSFIFAGGSHDDRVETRNGAVDFRCIVQQRAEMEIVEAIEEHLSLRLDKTNKPLHTKNSIIFKILISVNHILGFLEGSIEKSVCVNHMLEF